MNLMPHAQYLQLWTILLRRNGKIKRCFFAGLALSPYFTFKATDDFFWNWQSGSTALQRAGFVSPRKLMFKDPVDIFLAITVPLFLMPVKQWKHSYFTIFFIIPTFIARYVRLIHILSYDSVSSFFRALLQTSLPHLYYNTNPLPYVLNAGVLFSTHAVARLAALKP